MRCVVPAQGGLAQTLECAACLGVRGGDHGEAAVFLRAPDPCADKVEDGHDALAEDACNCGQFRFLLQEEIIHAVEGGLDCGIALVLCRVPGVDCDALNPAAVVFDRIEVVVEEESVAAVVQVRGLSADHDLLHRGLPRRDQLSRNVVEEVPAAHCFGSQV